MKKYLFKHTQIKEKNLKYDFLPPMLEVIERPIHKAGSIIIVSLILFLCSIVMWAVTTQLDIVVTANGAIKPEDNIIVISAGEQGTVAEILVKNGTVVQKGDLIARLECDAERASIEKYTYQRELLEVQRDIYEKIYSGVELSELEPEIEGKNYYVISGILEEQRYYLSMVEMYELQIENAEDKEEAEAALEAYVVQRNVQILQNIASCESQLISLEKELEQVEQNLQKKEIRATCDGTIAQMQVMHEGDKIAVNQTIAYIIPADANMIFQCYVKSVDIAQIAVGENVEVKLHAYEYSKYGKIEGNIQYISELAVSVEGVGTCFLVEVAIESREDLEYLSGLTGSCDIIVGKRTVLQYFLEPIEKGFGESLKEL